MPEILTKYPEIVLEILKDAGIECGVGASQKILTACPPERFCSLPIGEICVYGLNEIPKMTQISVAEITGSSSNIPITLASETVALIGIVAAIVGFLLAIFFLRYLRMLVKIIRRKSLVL